MKTQVVMLAGVLTLGLVVGDVYGGNISRAGAVIVATCGPAARPTVSTGAHRSVVATLNGFHWRLTLTRVIISQRVRGSYASYTAQGKLVSIFLVAQNLDKHPLYKEFAPDFQLADNHGRTFSPSSDGTKAVADQYNIDLTGDVQPTFSAPFVVSFDVAADAHGLTLMNNSVISGPVTLFKLGF